MDENKDFSVENTTDGTNNSDTDTTETLYDNNTESTELETGLNEENRSAELNTTSDSVPAADVSAQPTAVKKKSVIQIPVIIAAAIVVVVLLAFGIFKCFLNTSVVGTWTVQNTATADEANSASADEAEAAKIYYTFEDDGSAYLTLGTMKAVGTYTLTKDDNNSNVIEINVPNAITGTFNYNVSGNIFTGRVLELIEPTYSQSIKFDSANLVVPKLEPYKDFKSNDKLTGKWVYDAEYFKITYELKEDGTVTINQADMLYTDGVYKCTDDAITIKYYAAGESTMELTYEIEDDGSLILNGMQQYVKEDSSSEN